MGIEPATGAPGPTCSTSSARGACPRGIASLGKRCVGRWSRAGHRRVGAVRGRDRGRGPTSSIGADGIHSAVRTLAVRAGRAPGSPGRSATGRSSPTAGRARAASCPDVAADNGQWLGPHGPRFVLYPLRGEELINVVAHYERRHLPARVVGDGVRGGPRSSSGNGGVGTKSAGCGCSRPGRPGTSGRFTTGDPIPAWTSGRVSLPSATRRTRLLPYLGQGACPGALRNGAGARERGWSASPSDPVAALAAYERTPGGPGHLRWCSPRAGAGACPNHLPSRLGRDAAGRSDRHAAGGLETGADHRRPRRAAWLADYDATSPSVARPLTD